MEISREGGDPSKPAPSATVSTPSSSSQNATTTGAIARPGRGPLAQYDDGDSLEAMTPDQRRAVIEQLAQRLVDDALDDALELYLRLELQQTAEASVRAALAAAGAGRTKRTKSDHLEQVVESSMESAGGQPDGLVVDDEMSGGTDQDEDGGRKERESPLDVDGYGETDGSEGAHHTLTLQDDGGLLSGSEQGDPQAYSTSLSRLDAGNIFHDLSEMSNFADRIDSILDQTVSEHSTRSGRMRSASPMPQFAFDQQEHEDGDGEVD